MTRRTLAVAAMGLALAVPAAVLAGPGPHKPQVPETPSRYVRALHERNDTIRVLRAQLALERQAGADTMTACAAEINRALGR